MGQKIILDTAGDGSSSFHLVVRVDEAYARIVPGTLIVGATVDLAATWEILQQHPPYWNLQGPTGAIDLKSIVCDASWQAKACMQFVARVAGTYTITISTGGPPAAPRVVSIEAVAQSTLKSVSGKITFLRVNAIGAGYGPPTDFIDADVIVKLGGPGAYGLKLRDDANRHTDRAMFDLLREAYAHGWPVTLDYAEIKNAHNGLVLRVAVGA